MAMLVLLVPEAPAALDLGPEAAGRLADLGVAHVSVARDEEGVAVVLSGWSFDPGGSVDEAMEVLCEGGSYRALVPVAQMALDGGRQGR